MVAGCISRHRQPELRGCSGSPSLAFVVTWGWARILLSPSPQPVQGRRSSVHWLRGASDPRQHREALQRQQKAATAMTFKAATERYFKEHGGEWRSSKTSWLFTHLMETHTYPQIGSLAVTEIGLDDALKVLRPVWQTTNFSARRLMFWCRAAIDATRGEPGGLHPDRRNPFDWKAGLAHRLAKPSKIAKEEHHKAIDWKQVPNFMTLLRSTEGVDARMLELCVLTVTRTGAVSKMQWREVDWGNATWSVPPEHEKTHQPLRVPLSRRALNIVKQQRPVDARDDDLIWPSERTGGRRSPATLWRMVRRMGYDDSARRMGSEARSQTGGLADAVPNRTARGGIEPHARQDAAQLSTRRSVRPTRGIDGSMGGILRRRSCRRQRGAYLERAA